MGTDVERWQDLDRNDRALAERVKRFVDEDVAPYVAAARNDEWSASPSERVPWPLLERAHELGLRTLSLSVEHGGDGVASTLSLAVVAEELARGESSLVDILLQGWKVMALLQGTAPESVWRPWLERFVSEPRFLCSHCSTEPHGSSDRWLGNDVPEAAMHTRAELRDGAWILNGRKQFITNGPDSELYVVYATTTPGVRPSEGMSSFVVPRDAPGFASGKVYEKVGGRLFNNAELVFDDCRLPLESLLIKNTAAGSSGRHFRHSKVVIAAQAVGIAQAALEDAVTFSQHRVQGGKSIVRHQLVAARLADMATRVEATRAFVRHVARMVDARTENRRALSFMAKVHAGETAFRVARDAVELHGGLGVMRETGVERHLRDATLFFHLDGTNDIHRLKVASELFGVSPTTYASGEEPIDK